MRAPRGWDCRRRTEYLAVYRGDDMVAAIRPTGIDVTERISTTDLAILLSIAIQLGTPPDSGASEGTD